MTVDAAGTTGTIEVYVNGILQEWNPANDPKKTWAIQKGGTFEVRTSKATIKLTNVSSSQVDVIEKHDDNASGVELVLV